ncbi:hypothetical protein OsJ_29494 [Oryza sativa Japonica Group]|uniref:DDHD domain-containing protein n=1 Tax=Oryza sativa subsp. japonica TaxID=39947 RepID=B9G3T0_ORYSJ|nr:hypothetical protein OsJ_29494 [Oryza sativa Japonica Group]
MPSAVTQSLLLSLVDAAKPTLKREIVGDGSGALSLAVERDALLQEDSIVFALIKQQPTLPLPKLPVAGPLRKWNLANNNLEGQIPDNISSCINLISLNFSNNNLVGYISAEFGNLRSIMEMDFVIGNIIDEGIHYFTEDIAARSQAVARQFKSLKVKAVAALLSLSRNDTDEDVDSNNEKEKSYGYMLMERLTGSPDGRIDHVLQVYSCSNYWRDHDTALFILRHLYRDIPKEPPTDDPERMPIRLFYVRDPIAERLP